LILRSIALRNCCISCCGTFRSVNAYDVRVGSFVVVRSGRAQDSTDDPAVHTVPPDIKCVAGVIGITFAVVPS